MSAYITYYNHSVRDWLLQPPPDSKEKLTELVLALFKIKLSKINSDQRHGNLLGRMCPGLNQTERCWRTPSIPAFVQ